MTANGHTIEVQFEKAVYAEDNRFVFPTDGNTKTAEAERFEIHDVKDPTDGEWHCGVTAKDWASGGKIVNAMNKAQHFLEELFTDNSEIRAWLNNYRSCIRQRRLHLSG